MHLLMYILYVLVMGWITFKNAFNSLTIVNNQHKLYKYVCMYVCVYASYLLFGVYEFMLWLKSINMYVCMTRNLI